MKRKIISRKGWLILFILVSITTVSEAQTNKHTVPVKSGVLQLVEWTDGGKQIPVTGQTRIVEPNSVLHVLIDKDSLKKILSGNVMGQDVSDELSLLNAMLSKQAEAIKNLNEAISLYNANKPAAVWQKPLQNNQAFVRLILHNNKDKDARAIYNGLAHKPGDVIGEFQNLFTTAQLLIPKILNQITVQAKAQGVYVQLGAWLDAGKNSAPIHIEGFDEYLPQTPSSVERFQVVLTQDQQAQLDSITVLSQTANQQGLGAAIKQYAGNAGQGIAQKLKDLPAYKEATLLVASVENISAQDQQALGALKATIDDSYQAVTGYVADIDALIKKYSATPGTTDAGQLLQQVNSDISQLITESQALQTKLQDNAKTIAAQLSGLAGTIKTQVTAIKAGVDSLGNAIKNDVQNLGSAGDLFRQLVIGEQLTNLSHDFTDKVHQLSLDNLPDTALVDLSTAGKRDQGDHVIVKLGTGKPGETAKERFNQSYALYFCSIYARTAVGFLFVNPTPIFKRTDNTALFRFAPSYSILLKGFWADPIRSRQSLSYHTFWDPGLGLNFSSLDFKGDGSMSLGIGGVFSLFNDFLQLGYGVNTFDGRGYAFLGFRLPIGAFSIH
jgi:hypothetical protein